MRNRVWLWLCVFLMVQTVAIAQRSVSTRQVRIEFLQEEATFRVVMQLSEPIAHTPTLRFYGKQGWVYVDIPAGLVGKSKVQRVRQDGILWARYGWYQARPPLTRVWVATSEKRPAQLSREEDGRRLVLTVWKKGYSPEQAPVTQPSPPREEATPSAQATEPPVRPRPERRTTPIRRDTPTVAEAAAPAESDSEQAKLPAPTVSAQAPAPATSRHTVPEAPRVTVDFVGAEIADVLKALSLQTQTNIVTSPEVKGQVTVSLAGVTVEEALDLITRLSGYRYAKVGNTYIVASPQTLQSLLGEGQPSTPPVQPRITQTVSYRYVDPESLGRVIQQQAPDVQISWNLSPSQTGKGTGGRIALVSGPETAVRSVVSLIETVDATLAQAQQDSVIDTYMVKHASPLDLRTILASLAPEVTVILGPRPGFNLLAPAPLGDSAGRTVGQKGIDESLQTGAGAQAGGNQQQQGGGEAAIEQQVNMLILMGPRAAVERAKEALARIDVAPPQILIEARVVEVGTDADETLGVLWDFTNTRADFSLSTPNPPDRGNLGTIVFGRLTRDAIGLSAKLDALFKQNKARLLASPKLLVINAKQAQIFIGDEVRYIESVQSTQNGVTVTTGKVNVGIQLNVVAKTNPEGDISLQIHPEVSLITGFLKTPVGGEIPQVSRRFADSAVRLRSGETLVIGGLISQRDLRLVQKVPLLGDLPILGHLFKQTNTKRSNSEIMVFLTATVWKE